MMELGIIELLSKSREGISINEMAKELDISEYGIQVLIEAAERAAKN